MKKILITLMAIVMSAAMLSSCGSSTTETTTEETTAEETTSEETTEATTEEQTSEDLKIVSTVPSTTEIIFELGAGDMLVGVDSSSTYPAETADIEVIGDYNGFDVELIVSLEPDYVFVGETIQDDEIALLQEAGIETIAAEPTDFDGICEVVTLVGATLGCEVEAEELCNSINQAEEDAISAAAELDENPTIYYVMGIGEYGNWTSGEGSFINDIMEFCGATCITADAENAWIEYPVEDLVSADPDILIVSSYVTLEELEAADGYKDLTAVKEGHVYSIDADIVERPGPRVIEAISEIQADIFDAADVA